MVVFLVQGIDYKSLIELADSAIRGNTEGCPYMVGSADRLEIECFDSSMGKVYQGAEALAMLIEYRMKDKI